MWTVTVAAIEMKSKQQDISRMRSCLINQKARKPSFNVCSRGRGKTRQRFPLLCLERFPSRCWNVFEETKALTLLQILFQNFFFLFSLRSSFHFFVAWNPFCTLNIFQSFESSLSVFCASFPTSSVKCHFKRLVARRKCKVPCANWNEFVQIEIRRTLTAESSSSATELSLRNPRCELCFAFLFEFSFVPSPFPL